MRNDTATFAVNDRVTFKIGKDAGAGQVTAMHVTYVVRGDDGNTYGLTPDQLTLVETHEDSQ